MGFVFTLAFLAILSISLLVPIMIYFAGVMKRQVITNKKDQAKFDLPGLHYVIKNGSKEQIREIDQVITMLGKLMDLSHDPKSIELASKVANEYSKIQEQLCKMDELKQFTRRDSRVTDRKLALTTRSKEMEECIRNILVYYALLKDNTVLDDSEDCVIATKAYLKSVEQIEDWLNIST